MAKTTTLNELKAYAKRMSDDRLDGKADAFILESIQDAIKNLGTIAWSFLVNHYRLVTAARTSSPGGVTVTNLSRRVLFTSLVSQAGQPTLDKTWTAKFNGEAVDYDFASTASTTSVINLASSYVGTGNLTAASYTLFKRSYDLPADFRELLAIVDVRRPNWELLPASYAAMRELNLRRTGGDTPTTYSVENKTGDMVRQFWLYPFPSGTTRFQYDLIYARWPSIPTGSSAGTTVIDWPDDHMVLLKAAIYMELAKRAEDDQKYQLAKMDYQDKLDAAAKSDVPESAGMFIGHDRIRGGRRPGLNHYTITEGG